MPKLTEKKKSFVREYALDFNGAQAWMRSTGSDNYKSATVQASRLLKEAEVQEYLQEYLEGILGPHEKRIKENVEFWQMVRDDPAARTADRMKASENLAKHSQMFTEKHEVEHSGKVQIVDDIK
jgi:phage terminase small subunit